jgi:hypothetical protein
VRTGTCEWPSEKPLVLDLGSSVAMRHLAADAQLAEELAIRFADSEHERLTGYRGHGGLIENGRVINQCMAKLFGAIASTHQVPIEHVLDSRTARSAVFDIAVVLTFAVFYAFLVWAVVPIVWHRFSRDERWPTLGALVFLSLVISATGLQLGELWSVSMEMARLGNDHLGRRGLRIPWGQHRAVIFVGGVALFWLIATMRLRTANRDRKVVGASHAV